MRLSISAILFIGTTTLSVSGDRVSETQGDVDSKMISEGPSVITQKKLRSSHGLSKRSEIFENCDLHPELCTTLSNSGVHSAFFGGDIASSGQLRPGSKASFLSSVTMTCRFPGNGSMTLKFRKDALSKMISVKDLSKLCSRVHAMLKRAAADFSSSNPTRSTSAKSAGTAKTTRSSIGLSDVTAPATSTKLAEDSEPAATATLPAAKDLGNEKVSKDSVVADGHSVHLRVSIRKSKPELKQ